MVPVWTSAALKNVKIAAHAKVAWVETAVALQAAVVMARHPAVTVQALAAVTGHGVQVDLELRDKVNAAAHAEMGLREDAQVVALAEIVISAVAPAVLEIATAILDARNVSGWKCLVISR